MSGQGHEAAKEIHTHDFAQGEAFALGMAYQELGVFKQPETIEQARLFNAWASTAESPVDIAGITVTADDMRQTAELLREWGEPLTLLEPHDGYPEGSGGARRAATPNARSIMARIAVQMADDMEARIGTGQKLSTEWDDSAFYDYLDGRSDAA